MDRLPTLIALACLLAACDKTSEQQGEPTGRTNAAKVATKQVNTAAFCDKQFDRETGPVFAMPELAGGALAPATGWRWVNVWATWCKPCVDEMPRLVKWQAKLGNIAVQFVSVDASDDDVTAFRKLHPDAPPSVRLTKPEAQDGWLTKLGLDAGAPIPVHIFVDPSNHVRCIRAGGVRDQDYAMVEALVAGK